MRIFPLFAFAVLIAAPVTRSQQLTLPLWPHGTPEPATLTGPEKDITTPTDQLIAGKRVARLANVSEPSMAVSLPDSARNTGAAVLVFPGGGYSILAYDLEGTEVCDWLHSIGVACVLVKYRVPVHGHYPENVADLEDAQQAMRLTRSHAEEWHINPHRIGVLGFSAGGHLAAVISNHSDFKPAGLADSKIDARPDFAVIVYPGYLAEEPALTKLSRGVEPTSNTPPTFLLQAEDDPVHEENVLLYFQALKQVKVPAELHVFAAGGHGYGLRPTNLPITHWPAYVETWFHTIGVVDGPAPALEGSGSRGPATTR